MNSKRLVLIACLLAGVILLASAVASFEKGNPVYNITSTYGPGDTLTGWVNIGFTDEPANSLFEFSEGGSATLMSVLKNNGDYLYSCNPLTCTSNYVTSNPEASKILSLGEGESAIIGFEISEGAVESVDGFSLGVSSDADVLDASQLSIDILNDEENEWQAYKSSSLFGSERYGCYNPDGSKTLGNVIKNPYCQRITLPASPAAKIGAVLEGSGTVNFKMTIETVDGSEEGECTLEVSSGGSYSCLAEDGEEVFKIKESGQYFVCIQTKNTEDNNKYKINYQTIGDVCGFTGSFSGEYTANFEIFAQAGMYDAVGSFTLNNDELESAGSDVTNAEDYISDYLSANYDNDCTNGCVIPLKITANVAQTITLSNPSLGYTAGGISTEQTQLYDLEESPAEITSNAQKLYIDSAEFVVPDDYGDHTISLNFGGDEIFETKISIAKVPVIKYLNSNKTAATYPTPFIVKVQSEKNISSYKWEFGDGKNQTTATNKVTHTYDEIGIYNLKLSVTDIDGGVASKVFSIKVGSASEMIDNVLSEKKLNLLNIQAGLSDFNEFEQTALKGILNLDNASAEIDALEAANDVADTETEYQEVLGGLLEIVLPSEIYSSVAADVTIFFPETDAVSMGALAAVTGEDYVSSKESGYAAAVVSWDVQNIDIVMTYHEITGSFGDYNEPVVNYFDIDVTKKTGMDEEDVYIFIKDMEDMILDGISTSNKEGGYYYTPFVGETRKITLATSENVDFLTLPLFVSPAISELSLVDLTWSPLTDEGKLKRWILFTLIILLLLILGVVFWIIMQTWYRKKYEKHLFKDQNNLYNLIAWIDDAKKKGMNEKEIKAKLKKAGWTSEQLRYVTRKHAGKRTGMAEIPFKLSKKKYYEQ